MSRAIPVATGTADVQAHTGAATVVGVTVHETAATPAAAAVHLRDGTSAAGAIIATVEVAANDSKHVVLPAVDVAAGVFVDRTAGETELVVYVL